MLKIAVAVSGTRIIFVCRKIVRRLYDNRYDNGYKNGQGNGVFNMVRRNRFFLGASSRLTRRLISAGAVLFCAFALIGCSAAGSDPGGSSGGGAAPKEYTCSNGTPVNGTTTGANTERCASCDSTYKLVNNLCTTRTAYICPNGVVDSNVMGMNPEGNSDVVQCESCTNPYYLVTAEKRCSNLGTATRVGNISDFGASSEERPTGLAAIGSTLYMVGRTNDALYTLDITDDGTGTLGSATRVGNVDNFGVGETSVAGLAALGSTLYMVGSRNDALYTLDISDDGTGTLGGATRVGSATQFDAGESQPSGLAAIGSTLYMVGSNNDVLYTLDITNDGTGTFGGATRVGRTASGFGMNNEGLPTGLAAIDGTLYMVGWNTDALHTLDTSTGAATQVGGAMQFGMGVDEDRPFDLAAIGSILYMVGDTNNALYTLVYSE